MKLFALRSFALQALLLPAGLLMAQDRMDIGLHSQDGQLEVRVRPESDFDGIFSSVVFTLRWDKNADITLGELALPNSSATFMPVMRSGGVREGGTFNYQVFAGFGVEPLRSHSVNWEAGKEYTIARIAYTGAGVVELVNDAWTGELLNNANYYVSLGGVDRTGEIYQKSVNTEELDQVTIVPNPNNGEFTFTIMVSSVTDIQLEVVNTLGQAIFTDNLRNFEGTYRKEMDLRTMSNGIYYLKIKRQGNTSVHKIVYR